MSKKQETEINPVVKKWLVVGVRVIVIVLSAIVGDSADVVDVLSNIL
jgi:hypothetical protein